MAYSLEEYLLDRRNIEDTVHKLWLLFDLRLSSADFIQRCVDEVFTAEIRIDYTKPFGSGEPYDISSRTQAQQWAGFVEKLDASLHHTGTVMTDLPVPDGSVQRPDRTIVHVKATTTLRRGDSIAENGCVMELVLERLREMKGNVWRFKEMKVLNKVYERGDVQVVFA